MTNKSIEPSNVKTKRILVLRDGVNPSFVYASLACSILGYIWTFAQYIVTRDLQEPMIVRSIRPYYMVIDSNSYLVLLSITIIISIVTICCFRFSHKELAQ